MTRTGAVALALALLGCRRDPPSRAPATPPPAESVETAVLTALAGSAVSAMTPVGGVLAARLEQGQSGEQPITLEPGRCYAVVAAGLPELEELALAIVTPGEPRFVLAADDSTGTLAIAGARDACVPTGPVRRQALVVVTATRGQGVVALQLYAR